MPVQRDREFGAAALVQLGTEIGQQAFQIGGGQIGGFRVREQGVQCLAVFVIHIGLLCDPVRLRPRAPREDVTKAPASLCLRSDGGKGGQQTEKKPRSHNTRSGPGFPKAMGFFQFPECGVTV